MIKLPTEEKSFWREGFGASTYPTLDKDLEVDAVIVGGGITGLTTAYLLKQAGQKMALLEQRTVGAGTTARSTGKVSSQHGAMYTYLAERHGHQRAKAYAEANQTAVETIAGIIAEHNLACDWQLADNYVFTTDSDKLETLRREAAIADELGLPASFETSTPLPFVTLGAVKFAAQGKIHPQKYLTGLARLIDGQGSHVFENSRAMTFHDGEPAHVTANGHKITAKTIIVATRIPSFPLAARGGYALLEHPTESYGIACDVDELFEGMYISVDKTHQSLLPHEVEGKKVLLVVGAGGNIPGVRISKEKHYRTLADYAERHFAITRITNKWSDMDYLPYDRFPLVGRVYPTSKHMFMATGYMKWGLTNGTAAALMLRDLALGEKNELQAEFESMRSGPIVGIPRAVFEHFKNKLKS